MNEKDNVNRRNEHFSVKRIVEGLITTAVGAAIVVYAAVKVLEEQTQALRDSSKMNRDAIEKVADKLGDINLRITTVLESHISADDEKQKDLDKRLNRLERKKNGRNSR